MARVPVTDIISYTHTIYIDGHTPFPTLTWFCVVRYRHSSHSDDFILILYPVIISGYYIILVGRQSYDNMNAVNSLSYENTQSLKNLKNNNDVNYNDKAIELKQF